MIINTPTCDDKLMWDLWLSRQQLLAVTVADELNMYDSINQGNNTISLLSYELSIEIKGIEALTCLLAVLGFLKKIKTSISLTEVSKNYLLPQSAFYWGAALNKDRENLEYQRILKAFKNHGTSHLMSNDKSFTAMWETGEIDADSAKQFTSIMHCTILNSAMNAVQSGVFDNTTHLIDIGAGSGCFVNSFINYYPNKKATIFELPSVCDISRNYLDGKKINHAIELYPGNFFKDPFPTTGDGILFSNIFHDWQLIQGQFLAKRAYDALPKGGKIFIHEMLLNEDKNGPLPAASFNLLMYVNHTSQQFTQTEIFTLLNHTGFVNCKSIAIHPCYSMIVGEKQ